PYFVRLDEQLGETSPQLERLFRRQVHRQLVQQTHELTYVRGSRDLALRGEPAFQLNATGAAGGRSTQEVAQAVRTQADFSRHTSQRELGRLPRQAVPQQRDRQGRDGQRLVPSEPAGAHYSLRFYPTQTTFSSAPQR